MARNANREPPAKPGDAPGKTVFIVDDHPVFRDGLVRIATQIPGLSVCGEAGSAEDAFTAICQLKPDLVITDITLPGKSGLELVRDLQAMEPSLPVLVISMHDEGLYAERVLRAGGRGYIMKHEGPGRMLEAIERVLRGSVVVSEKMASELLQSLSRPRSQEGGGPAISKLTDREFEVLRMIGEGRDTPDVAEALHLSTKTVDTHRAHLRQKLGLKNNTELVRYAVQWLEEQ